MWLLSTVVAIFIGYFPKLANLATFVFLNFNSAKKVQIKVFSNKEKFEFSRQNCANLLRVERRVKTQKFKLRSANNVCIIVPADENERESSSSSISRIL